MKIAISGTGYVGIVAAAFLAEIGHDIVCVDVDEQKLQAYREGKCPIYEPGLNEILTAHSKNIQYTSDAAMAYRDSEVVFIAVGTPEKADGSANLKYVYEVCKQIGEYAERDCIVVVKSTVPIGVNDEVEKQLKKHTKNNIRIDVVSNPEFLAQGTAVNDMLYASRIVIGAESEHAFEVMKRVYKGSKSPILCTDRRSAEMIKYASNDFLAVKIAYINEIANLCEKLGANIEDVARGMGFDHRIGAHFLNAGIGYGGSCFPKDTKALHWLSVINDNEIKTVKAAIEVNSKQKIRLIQKAKQYYPSFEGLTVAMLGLAFKPGTDDLREAPSLSNVPIILGDGGTIKAWDPVAEANFKKLYPEIQYCATIAEALKDADICLIMTEWQEVRELKPADFAAMKKPIILDGRNCYALNTMKDEQLIYNSIGRRTVGNLTIGEKD